MLFLLLHSFTVEGLCLFNTFITILVGFQEEQKWTHVQATCLTRSALLWWISTSKQHDCTLYFSWNIAQNSDWRPSQPFHPLWLHWASSPNLRAPPGTLWASLLPTTLPLQHNRPLHPSPNISFPFPHARSHLHCPPTWIIFLQELEPLPSVRPPQSCCFAVITLCLPLVWALLKSDWWANGCIHPELLGPMLIVPG